MNGIAFRSLICCVAGLLIVTSSAYGEKPRVFLGEISDSRCALSGQPLTTAHQEVLKSKSMRGSSNNCAVYCITHLGAYLVLSAGKDAYRLDRVDLVRGFEGQKVKITGFLDAKLNRIHVLKIEPDGKP